MTGPIRILLTDGQTMFQALVHLYGEGALELSPEFDADPNTGFEGGRFLNSIRGVLEAFNPPIDQYLKITTPSKQYCSFGVDHAVDSTKGDEVGSYTLEIEDVIKSQQRTAQEGEAVT